MAGVKVEFEMRKLGFAVVFYRPDISIHTDKNSDSTGDSHICKDASQDASKDTSKERVAHTVTTTDTCIINGVQLKIIALMRENPRVSASQIANSVGIAQRNIQKHISILKDNGVIKRVGSAKTGYWEVLHSI